MLNTPDANMVVNRFVKYLPRDTDLRDAGRQLLVALLWLALVVCGNAVAQAGSVQLFSGQHDVDVIPHTDYILDPDKALSFVDLAAHGDQWQAVTTPSISFGFNPAALWLRIPLSNQDSKPAHFLLEIGYPVLDQIDTYIQRTDDVVQHRRMGAEF